VVGLVVVAVGAAVAMVAAASVVPKNRSQEGILDCTDLDCTSSHCLEQMAWQVEDSCLVGRWQDLADY
jgi:hypothetical protein